MSSGRTLSGRPNPAQAILETRDLPCQWHGKRQYGVLLRQFEVASHPRAKVQSWYFDVNLLASYWGQDRVYHRTAPISMNYALHEALRLTLSEGLEARFARH